MQNGGGMTAVGSDVEPPFGGMVPIDGLIRCAMDAIVAPPPSAGGMDPAKRPGMAAIKQGNIWQMHSASFARTGPGRYLQLEIFSPAKGRLHLSHSGAIIDSADVAAGWSFCGVDAGGVAEGAHFTLTFVANGDAPDTPDNAQIQIARMRFADDWGLALRRQLACTMPFAMMGIGIDFDAYPCCARQWLRGNPRAGNSRTDNIADLWNAPAYQEMRADFLKGNYTAHCREDICPVLRNGSPMAQAGPAAVHAINEGQTQLTGGPQWLNHDIDRGCNLACTMCRDDRILPERQNVAQARTDIEAAVLLGSLREISFSGAGEITIMRDIVRLLESDIFSSRNISISMTSNATGFTPAFWQRIGHNRLQTLALSIDGASAQTYEKIRIGGNWARLCANLDFIASLRAAGKIQSLVWQYTVQKSTMEDIPAAIALARQWGFDAIRLIAQFGALKGTDGNMFEDDDRVALDRLDAILHQCNAYADPFVMASELGMANGQYRTAAHRIGIAQQIFDRGHWVLEGQSGVLNQSIAHSLSILDALRGDMASGAVEMPSHLNAAHHQFITQILAQRAPRSRWRDRLRLRRTAGRISPPLKQWLYSLSRLAQQ